MTTTTPIARKCCDPAQFDMMLSSWSEDCLSPWLEDRQLLKQLLYRNRYQHGPTLIFRRMKSVLRSSGIFVDQSHWALLRRAQVEVAALSASTKLTTTHVQKLLAQRQLLQIYVSRAADVVHHIVKAARATAVGLQRRTFATLFAAWASFVGSFYSFFKNVLKHSLLPALAAAEDKLRMVAQVASHSKLRQLAQQVLADEGQQLSAQVQAILATLSGGPRPAAAQSSDAATVDAAATAAAATADAPAVSGTADRSAPFALGEEEEEDLPPYSAPPAAAAADRPGDDQSPDPSTAASMRKRPAEAAAIADDIDDIFGGGQATARKTKKRRADKTRGEQRPERRPVEQRPPPAAGDDIDDIFFAFNRAVASAAASRAAK